MGYPDGSYGFPQFTPQGIPQPDYGFSSPYTDSAMLPGAQFTSPNLLNGPQGGSFNGGSNGVQLPGNFGLPSNFQGAQPSPIWNPSAPGAANWHPNIDSGFKGPQFAPQSYNWGDVNNPKYQEFNNNAGSGGMDIKDGGGNSAKLNKRGGLIYDYYGTKVGKSDAELLNDEGGGHKYNSNAENTLNTPPAIPTGNTPPAIPTGNTPRINRDAPNTTGDQGQNALFDLAQQNEAFRASRIDDWRNQLTNSPYDFNSAMNQQKLAQQGAGIQAAGAAKQRDYQEVHRGGIGADESGVMQNDTNFRQAQNANALQNDLFDKNVDYGNRVRAALDSLQGNDMGGQQLENFNANKTTSDYNHDYTNLAQQRINLDKLNSDRADRAGFLGNVYKYGAQGVAGLAAIPGVTDAAGNLIKGIVNPALVALGGNPGGTADPIERSPQTNPNDPSGGTLSSTTGQSMAPSLDPSSLPTSVLPAPYSPLTQSSGLSTDPTPGNNSGAGSGPAQDNGGYSVESYDPNTPTPVKKKLAQSLQVSP